MSYRMKLLGAAVATAGLGQGAAFAQAPFYQGKTITMYVGYTPGGLYDLTTRLVAKHIPKHLAGGPTVVVQNMPGAGGTKALMHIYSIAPKDGTVMGMVKR